MNTIQFVIRLIHSLIGPRFYATGNLDAADLAAVAFGGLINESLMQRIWDISRIPLMLTDRVSSDDTKNDTHAWTQDVLAQPDLTNAVIDGQDTDSINDTSTGDRVQNFHQISIKVVQVSSRADASDTVGKAEELAYQVMMRQRELRRDREAIALTQQASLKDTGAAAGNVGAHYAWLETNVDRGALGSNGGFNFLTGVVDAPTAGTGRALSETAIRDVAQSVYDQGGDPTAIMSTTSAIRRLSEYMFTSSARIATLTSDVKEKMTAAVATGAVNVFVTDFGVTMEMLANRLHPVIALDDVNVVCSTSRLSVTGYCAGSGPNH